MKKLLLVILAAIIAIPAAATQYYYSLNASFQDGGSIVGGFDWNPDAFGNLNHVDGIFFNVATSTSYAAFYSDTIGNFQENPYYIRGNASISSPIYFNLVIDPNGPSLNSGETVNLLSTSIAFYNPSDPNGGAHYLVEGAKLVQTRVPEPAMLGLFGLGAIGLALSRRRKA